MDPKSVAVEGIGYGPLAVATEGFQGDQQDGVTLTQTNGVASSEVFGSNQARLSVSSTGVATSEEFGASPAEITTATSGLASSEAYGNATGSTEASASGLASDEGFGAGTLNVIVNSIGLGSDEAFGQSHAQYDRTITQFAGIESEEVFGASGVTRDETTNQRPRIFARLRGSSSSGHSSSASWDVTVHAEMLKRAGLQLEDEEKSHVRGTTRKAVNNEKRVVVRGRLMEADVYKETKPSVVVQGRLLELRVGAGPIVSASKVNKVA